MPYLPESRKKELKANPILAITEGDCTYLFTLKYIEEFLKEPRYHTIQRIGNPIANFQSVRDLYKRLHTEAKVPELILWGSLSLAFAEFYRRIGVLYEDYAIEKNGDVEEYLQAEQLIYSLSSNGVQKTN